MSSDEIIIQIVAMANGQIVGLSNEGNLYLFQDKKWTKF